MDSCRILLCKFNDLSPLVLWPRAIGRRSSPNSAERSFGFDAPKLARRQRANGAAPFCFCNVARVDRLAASRWPYFLVHQFVITQPDHETGNQRIRASYGL
jgi:hypothetical protein